MSDGRFNLTQLLNGRVEVTPRLLLALVEAVSVSKEIDERIEAHDEDFDTLNLLYTRKRMAFDRFEFDEGAA